MIRTQIIRKLEKVKDPELKEVLISFLEEVERIIGETVTRKEFREFVKQTQENFDRVWHAIKELTEAQKRTEERLNELAEAQKRTEERLNELAEAQKRTEEELNELAEAQKRTEEELAKLAGEHRKTREQVGGLSHSIGYILEDRAYKGLPEILQERYGIKLIEPLKRDYIEVGRNKYLEVNILGRGRIDGKELYIVGECKTQLKKKDVDKFLKYAKNLDRYLRGEKFIVFVTYQASPPVAKYVKEKGLNLIYSYELPL